MGLRAVFGADDRPPLLLTGFRPQESAGSGGRVLKKYFSKLWIGVATPLGEDASTDFGCERWQRNRRRRVIYDTPAVLPTVDRGAADSSPEVFQSGLYIGHD